MIDPADLRARMLDRRSFLARAGAAGLSLSAGGVLLSACGGVEGTGAGTSTAPAQVAVNHPEVPIERLNFTNWTLYIDPEVIEEFEQEFGGSVRYVEEINDNEEFFGKVRAQLERGQDIERDIVVLTDWMAARWIASDFLEPIDKKNVPNAANLVESLQSPPFDPERNFTLPWQSGITAIGYDRRRTGRELTSINDLFDPKFKGRVTMLTEARDSATLVMLGQGKDSRTAGIDDVLAAIEKIDEENRNGQIRRFTGNDYTTDLTAGNVWVALAYSGDVVQLQADNPDLEFLIPEEGAVLWSDNMMLPKGAANPYAAETMMNYVYDPVVAAKIAAEVNYVTPVAGAREELEKTDPETAANELIFPSDETLAKLRPYPDLSPAEERQMNQAMQEVIGA
jgi:spermidine/putrescine transport system substrate-binding protein